MNSDVTVGSVWKGDHRERDPGFFRCHCITQAEHSAVWQRLAPQEFVVPAEGWAEGVRVAAGRGVGSEIEGGVEHVAG